FAGHYDTLSYTLTNNLLDIQGPNITSSIPYQITSLSDSQLIISGTNPRFPILHILDSLRR
ncbi:MAG TPA: hypothetical protein VGR89_04300, partial [Puia sp.]|nr:hypothetical protein [Puia sp.]